MQALSENSSGCGSGVAEMRRLPTPQQVLQLAVPTLSPGVEPHTPTSTVKTTPTAAKTAPPAPTAPSSSSAEDVLQQCMLKISQLEKDLKEARAEQVQRTPPPRHSAPSPSPPAAPKPAPILKSTTANTFKDSDVGAPSGDEGDVEKAGAEGKGEAQTDQDLICTPDGVLVSWTHYCTCFMM